MKNYTGELKGKARRIAIVLADFYKDIGEALLSGASSALLEHGVKENDISIYTVPGALEIPIVIKKLAETKSFDGIIALGAVIRGATAHFEYVSEFSSQASSQVGLDFGIPVMNGILTVENRAQAIERTNGEKENKGRDCGEAVLKMIDLLEQI